MSHTARKVRAFAPGRTEIAGNHTDHQGGRVVAAAVDCGVELVAQPNGGRLAHVESEGFAPVEVDLSDVAPRASERFTTAALVRGIVAGVRAAGVPVEGFDARVRSTVPSGGGLSSSAAFELALTAALAVMGDGATLAGRPVQMARIGQAAERDYFGKMCGLMDQLTVACGGVAAFDFQDEAEPRIERIPFDLEGCGYALALIDAHCDHSRYTEEYSQVARDMDAVAGFLGAPSLSRVPEGDFFARFEDVRDRLGDAPALRGLHYYHEMRLVARRIEALRAADMPAFLSAMRQSGASSAQYLQNVSTFDRASQPAMVALALADWLLAGDGACRIHGGGFGGTVQAFVPAGDCESFAQAIDAHLGQGSCQFYRIYEEGAQAQWL